MTLAEQAALRMSGLREMGRAPVRWEATERALAQLRTEADPDAWGEGSFLGLPIGVGPAVEPWGLLLVIDRPEE